MITRIADYLFELRDRQRLCIALSKGSAMMQARDIDLGRPATWEFSGFSQNGEDGIIDVLRRQTLLSQSVFRRNRGRRWRREQHRLASGGREI